MKKVVFILIALIFTLYILTLGVSCGNNTDSGTTGTDAATDEIAGDVETPDIAAAVRIEADLPELDLKGRDFVILHAGTMEGINEVFTEEENGDPVNDAVYKRNRIVEARFNCVIKEYIGDYHGISDVIRKIVRAQDGSADAAINLLNRIPQSAAENSLLEYSELPYLDFEKPWWNKESIEGFSICGRTFAACSDFIIMDKRFTTSIVFNKQIIADNALESPYDLVRSGDWTIEKIARMSKDISRDLDGNGIYDDKDIYGIIYFRDTMMSLVNGCGEFFARKDGNNRPYISINTERALSAIEAVFDLLYNPTDCFHAMIFFDRTGGSFAESMVNMFQEDKALFMHSYMKDNEFLRGMRTDFGIVPMPKYNKEQEKYYSNVNPYAGRAIIFPKVVKSVEESSAVIEALSCEGKYILQPAYYDICLTSKIARDEDSEKMLDIIFENRIFDIGDIYDFGSLASTYIYMSMNYNRNFVSMFEKSQAKAEKAVEKVITQFEALD